MALSKQHDLHKRRFGRNLGVGLTLVAFIALVFGLTIVKVTSQGIQFPEELSQSGGSN